MTEKQAQLTGMYRSTDAANGGPTEAEVHPDEVENYSAAGWSAEKPSRSAGVANERSR